MVEFLYRFRANFTVGCCLKFGALVFLATLSSLCSITVVQASGVAPGYSLLSATPSHLSAGERVDLSNLDLQLSDPPEDETTILTIKGSNTVGAQLAPRLVEDFFQALGATRVHRQKVAAENEYVIIGTYKSGAHSTKIKALISAHGSSTGFKALEQTATDIAASSRPIKEQEKAALIGKKGMYPEPKETVLGIDGLAIIVHRSNSIDSLSLDQLRGIYTGEITHWAEVGGQFGSQKKAIKILARDDKSGTYDTFKHLVLRKDKLTPRAVRFESNSAINAVVQGDVNAIGFVALAAANHAKALQITDGSSTGLEPTELSVATEDYALSRRLYLYRATNPKNPVVVNAFLDFAESDAGQSIVKEVGYVSQKLYALANEGEEHEDWLRLNLNIRFEQGTSNVDNKAESDIQRLISFLNSSNQGFNEVRLVGFSNPLDENQRLTALSRIRAQNVRWALRNQGLRSPIETLSGSAIFVADPTSIRSEKNRRVEVWVH